MTEEPRSVSPSYEELYQQNLALRRAIDELKADRERVGNMLVELSRRLQVSSASSKAAVSSLLDQDMIWGLSNQHEFLKTIEASIDQTAQLIRLLVFASAAEARSLRPKIEPQMLQEVLSFAQDRGKLGLPEMDLQVNFPTEGRPVLVDFEYLTVALGLLFEVFRSAKGVQSIRLQATEGEESWWLDFEGLDSSLIQLIQSASQYGANHRPTGDRLTIDNVLRLFVVWEMLCLQSIRVEVLRTEDGSSILRLTIPSVPGDAASLHGSTILGRE